MKQTMKSELICVFLLISCVFTVNSLPFIRNNKANDLNATAALAIVPSKVDDNKEKNEILAPEQVESQGVCDQNRRPLIYTENFILNSDQLSQVSAGIKIQMSGETKISCVELFDMKRANERPKLMNGGPGHNWVEIGISPEYGEGFYFTVKIYGDYFP